MRTHGFCVLAIFFTDLLNSSRWWARRKIGRDSDIWSSGRWLFESCQISRKVGKVPFASRKISWTNLYNEDWRPKGNDTYTWAANCPSTWGVVRIRPWCNAGLSTGAGGNIDEEIGGNFLHWSKLWKKSQKYLRIMPSLGFWHLSGLFWRIIVFLRARITDKGRYRSFHGTPPSARWLQSEGSAWTVT